MTRAGKIKKPVIFVTNDDGIHAPGLRALIGVMRRLGRVVVVAPDSPQSGTAHAITVNVPLRLNTVVIEEDYEEYSCNGTPADCVKMGFKIVLEARPDLLVSGINHGSNASVNIIYSGTLAAVLEGCMASVPSIGYSLTDYSWDADFDPSLKYVETIAESVLERGLADGVCLNVNIPNIPENNLKGIKVCHQSGGSWQEDFDERTDPMGRKYYWLKGIFIRAGDGGETDIWALENHYIAVVPVHTDMTAYQAISSLEFLERHV
jgi:5'-nucleotidase